MIKDTIVFTVCQRPWYLREALASWGEARGVHDWRLIFMVEDTPMAKDAAKVIEDFHHPDKQVVFNPGRFGVLINPWEGMEKSFRTGAMFSVLAEEDLIVSDDVLEYMTWARAEFENDPAVLGAMCQLQGTFETTDPEQVMLVQDFNPWIWGTWWDRWFDVLRDTWDKDYSTGNPDGSQAGWDWNIAKRVLPKFDMQFAVTGAARSQNIGKHMGEHANPDDFEGTLAKTFRNHRPGCSYRLADNT